MIGVIGLIWFFYACNPFYRASPIPDLCTPADSCQIPSLRIWEAFKGGTGLDDMPLPGIYCGDCFFEGKQYDPLMPHRGIVLIDMINEQCFFDALFSFYPQYDSCQPEVVIPVRKALYSNLNAPGHELNWEPDLAWVLLNPEVERDHILYYLRQAQSSREILLIGVWQAGFQPIFCRLKRVADTD